VGGGGWVRPPPPPIKNRTLVTCTDRKDAMSGRQSSLVTSLAEMETPCYLSDVAGH